MNKIDEFLAAKKREKEGGKTSDFEPSIALDQKTTPSTIQVQAVNPIAEPIAPIINSDENAQSTPQELNKIDAFLAQKKGGPVAPINDPQQDQLPERETKGADIDRALLQGITFGWSDELGALAAAAAVKALGSAGSEKDFKDIYRDMKAIVNDEEKSFADANPKTQIGLEVLGGLSSGGLGGAKAMGGQAVKNMGGLGKTFTGSAIGAGEGALAGAGGADEGERLTGAGQGAAIGAALPAALGAGKAGLDVISNRRVQQDLVDGAGNFTPLNLAADEGSFLQNKFQKWIAPSLGGGQLRAQNREVIGGLEDAANTAKANLDDVTGPQAEALKQNLRQNATASSVPSSTTQEQLDLISEMEPQQALEALNRQWQNGFSMVKNQDFNVSPNEIADRAIEDLTGVVDEQYQTQVRSIIKQQLNKGFTPDTAPAATPYRTSGLGSVKNPDVELSTGKIAGENLMQARNELRMTARDLGDDGAAALQKNALNRAADSIDVAIRDGLNEVDPALAKGFDDELNAWGNFQTVRGATEKAATTQQGFYEPTQLIQSAKEGSRKASGTGNARFQDAAQQVQVTTAKAEQAAKSGLSQAKADLDAMKSLAPKVNPTPWESIVSTGALAAPFLPKALQPIMMPVGFGIGKAASTEGAQRALAGQTAPQELIAKLLRQYDGSGLQQAGQAAQFALPNATILEQQRD